MDLMLLLVSIGVLVFFATFGTAYALAGGTKHVQQRIRLTAAADKKTRVDWRHASLSRLNEYLSLWARWFLVRPRKCRAGSVAWFKPVFAGETLQCCFME
jgi:hypothetical protein